MTQKNEDILEIIERYEEIIVEDNPWYSEKDLQDAIIDCGLWEDYSWLLTHVSKRDTQTNNQLYDFLKQIA